MVGGWGYLFYVCCAQKSKEIRGRIRMLAIGASHYGIQGLL